VARFRQVAWLIDRELAMTFDWRRIGRATLLGAALVAFGAEPGAVAAQPAIRDTLADASTIDRSHRRAYCDAQLRALKQSAGLGDGQSDQAFMETCLADVDPVAVLPGPAAVMNAPVGSTGVCNDGTYSSAIRRDGACSAHGGLARWFGQ